MKIISAPTNHAERPLAVMKADVTVAIITIVTAPGQNCRSIGFGPTRALSIDALMEGSGALAERVLIWLNEGGLDPPPQGGSNIWAEAQWRFTPCHLQEGHLQDEGACANCSAACTPPSRICFALARSGTARANCKVPTMRPKMAIARLRLTAESASGSNAARLET